MEHVIETEGQTLYGRPYRLDQFKLAQAKAEFQKLELAEIICRSDSPFKQCYQTRHVSFPLHW